MAMPNTRDMSEIIGEGRATKLFSNRLDKGALARIANNAAEKAGADFAELTLETGGFLFKKTETVKAKDVTQEQLDTAKSVNVAAKEGGLKGFFSADPTVAEGSVERGVARLHKRNRAAKSVMPTRMPEVVRDFDRSTLREMVAAIQENRPNTAPVVSAESTTGVRSADTTRAPGFSIVDNSARFRALVDQESGLTRRASLFDGASAVSFIAANAPSHDRGSAAEVFAKSDAWRTLTSIPDFFAAASDKADKGGVDFMGAWGAHGGQIGSAPVANGHGVRQSVRDAILAVAQEAQRVNYKTPEGWTPNANNSNAPALDAA